MHVYAQKSWAIASTCLLILKIFRGTQLFDNIILVDIVFLRLYFQVNVVAFVVAISFTYKLCKLLPQ